jgi:hypothetical protein
MHAAGARAQVRRNRAVIHEFVRFLLRIDAPSAPFLSLSPVKKQC